MWHTRRLHVHFEESLFEIFVQGREGLKQNVARPTNQRMAADRVGRVGGKEMQKTRGRTQTKNVAYQA